MKSKLITIGDEILIGQVINTNAAFIGDKLFSIGIPLEKTVVIGDEENILLAEFKDSLNNYDVTIITGGLGPTHDDITKPALVKFFNDELVTDEKVLEHVKNIFSSRNLTMVKVNEAQALVPKNSRVIWNANGTAPGIWIDNGNKVFIAMPGVPYEMKSMFEKIIITDLKKKYSDRIKSVYLHKTLLTTGLGESVLSEKIGNIKDIIGDSKLAFLPSSSEVRLRINSEGRTEAEAQKKINYIEKKLTEKIGDCIYGINQESLEEVIVKILKEKKKTLSVAESITGGRISSRIVSVPGCSEIYMGGICTYANDEKIRLINVKEETLKRYGAVSEQTAIEMAEGVREIMDTDYSISTTGIAGPEGGSEKKPVGLVWIGFADKDKSHAMRFLFGSDREINIQRASTRALEILRRELLNIKIKF